MNKQQRLEEHYGEIRESFEEELIENGYDPEIVDEVNDGRDSYVEKEWSIFKDMYQD